MIVKKSLVDVPDNIKEVLAAFAETQKFKALPKCDRCGSQHRKEDGKCICGAEQ